MIGLHLLASAIAGRRVGVSHGEGDERLASSDGYSVLLPARDPGSEDDACGWQQVAAQAALIGAGSLAPALLRGLVGRPEAARRYAYLEVRRAARLLADRLPSAFLLLAELQGRVETGSAAESLAVALSRRRLPRPPRYFGSVRPLVVIRRAVSEEGIAALTGRELQGRLGQSPLPEFSDDDATEESGILRLFQNPLAGSNPVSDMLSRLLGVGRSTGARNETPEQADGAEVPIGRVERALRRGIHAVMAHLPFDVPDMDARAETVVAVYKEWDRYRGKYRPGWAFIEEVEARRGDVADAPGVVLRRGGPELKRQLAALGLDHEMHRRQQDGAELDQGRLLECAVDLATGHSPPSLNVYRSSRRTRRDLAVVVVVDISGSTGEKNGESSPVFERQLQAAYRLGGALHELGDTVAMFGFHSWGRRLVRAVRLKGARERWSGRVAERFAQLEPVGYTRTGAAIRHAARTLRRTMRLPNRLLILITDGIPYDQDYELAYAEADTAKALEEARADGNACVCLCIGGSAELDTLQRIFGAGNILAVDEPGQMTMRIRMVCQRALAAVSHRGLK